MPPGVHEHLRPWSLPLPISLALALAGLIYIWVFPSRRAPAFLGGLVCVWIAVASPIVMLDHQLLTIHMVKHLLLMAAGAPLLLWGMPEQWWGRRRIPMVLCWFCATATVIGWHIPAAFQLALQSQRWHEAEMLSFLLAGFLFWWPVVRPGRSGWSVPLYLFLATLPCDILSGFLVFCGRVIYPSYLAVPRTFELSPLQDQELAGALMWVSVTLIYLVPAAVITVQMLSPRGER